MYLDCWLVRYMIVFREVLISWVPTNSVPKTPQVGNLLVLESPSSPVCVLPNTMLSQTPTSRNRLLKNPHLVLENVLCKSEFLRTAPSFEVLARDFCDKLDDELKLSGNTKKIEIKYIGGSVEAACLNSLEILLCRLLAFAQSPPCSKIKPQ